MFAALAHARCGEGVAKKAVIHAAQPASVAVWCVPPGEEVKPHRHPAGQDTWVVLSGEADYYLGDKMNRRIRPGGVAIAGPGEIHGGRNAGTGDFVFVSVVSPAEAGFEEVDQY